MALLAERDRALEDQIQEEPGLRRPEHSSLKGTNEDIGKKILSDSGLPIITADSMADAATKIVAAVS